MYKKLTKLLPVFVAFLMFVNLPAYAYNDEDTELYDAAYDTCLIQSAEDDDLMGFLQTQEDFNGFCGCAAYTIVDIYNEDISESEIDAAIEQRAIQCVQPYIKPFITNTCLAAAADSGLTDTIQQCECFGEHVEAQSANNISAFFAETDKNLEASAQYCHLFE